MRSEEINEKWTTSIDKELTHETKRVDVIPGYQSYRVNARNADSVSGVRDEQGVTITPRKVTAGSQNFFGRRLCSRMNTLAASARRNKRSMSVNYEVREILDLIGTEATIEQSTQIEEIE